MATQRSSKASRNGRRGSWKVPLGLLTGSICLLLSSCSPSSSVETTEAIQSARAFTEVTEEAGLAAFRHNHGGFGEAWAPEIVGAGGGFLDYDGDGWQDILLVGGGSFRERNMGQVHTLWLYRNNGDGTFRLVSEEAGLAGVSVYGLGIVSADYDNDGDADFFLTTLYENMLFRNDAGVFTEVGKEAGLAEHSAWSTSALFFDANADGWLDLYVGNYVDWSPDKDLYCAYEGEKVYCTPEEYAGYPSRFYQNNGDGTFTERTQEAGFATGIETERDKTLGVAELDFNKDGWPDLVVANDTERDQLYQNNGDGTFTERGILSGIAYDKHGKARAGMGVDVGVVDSTGQVSIFVGNFSDETAGVYRHTGQGLFMERAASSKIGHPSLRTLTFGLILLDVDLDTDLDLLAANGHVQTHIEKMLEGITFRQPAQLYLNRGDGVFDEYNAESGALSTAMVARAAAYADYDRDGDLDVLLTENNGPAHLWRNDFATGKVLRVHLKGQQSNKDGLGARITATVGPLKMERRVRTGSSYLSQSELSATFGLADAEQVDTLTVHWPSGHIDRFENVQAGHGLYIEEGRGIYKRDTVPMLAPDSIQ